MADIRPETPFPPNPRKVKTVAQGSVVERKEGFFSKLVKIFFVDDFRTVTGGVVADVILPGLRDMFFDAMTGGASRAVYGDGTPMTRNRSASVPISGNKDYGRYSRTGRTIGFRSDAEETTEKIQAKSTSNELLFPTREAALTVKHELIGTIQEYGVASVHDLHRMAGIERTWAQDSFGWDADSLSPEDITITHTREGWLLHLPRPIRIEI